MLIKFITEELTGFIISVPEMVPIAFELITSGVHEN